MLASTGRKRSHRPRLTLHGCGPTPIDRSPLPFFRATFEVETTAKRGGRAPIDPADDLYADAHGIYAFSTSLAPYYSSAEMFTTLKSGIFQLRCLSTPKSGILRCHKCWSNIENGSRDTFSIGLLDKDTVLLVELSTFLFSLVASYPDIVRLRGEHSANTSRCYVLYPSVSLSFGLLLTTPTLSSF